MRVVNLLAVLVVIGVIAYSLIFRPPWLMNLVGQGGLAARGYLPAKTPTEAMDGFARAIKNRDFTAAASYVTRDYAEALNKVAEGATRIGTEIDRSINLMKDKGITTDKTLFVLYRLDPFPTYIKVKDVKTSEEKKGTAVGAFSIESPTLNLASVGPTDLNGLEGGMFLQNLMPPVEVLLSTPLVAEGEGDSKVWKLNIPYTPAMREKVDLFERRWRTYATALDRVVVDLRNGRYASPRDAEKEVLQALAAANPK